jgi:hypothetical protein
LLADAYRDEDSCSFNAGTLVFLPKKPSEHDEWGGPIFLPGDTRPLCIVDTSNRLLANAARLRWEAALEGWLSPEQRGFLPRRSMLANVVDLEEAAMHATLAGDDEDGSDPGVLLFDFAAAFPSISQQFLAEVLSFVGFPPCSLHLVAALYYQHMGTPTLSGTTSAAFPLSAGIRQGCPLSPLLFVVAMDGLLRRIRRESSSTCPRAFADDLAAVVRSLATEAPVLKRIFDDIASAAGLHLNVAKCICIPLHLATDIDIAASLAAAVPGWANMRIQTHGAYLGFEIGPDKRHRSWSAALAKATQRVQQWDWGSLGLFWATQVWNTYVVPTLLFVAQLETPPDEVDKALHSMLRRAAYGPGNWFRPADVTQLRRSFGFPGEFRDVVAAAEATRYRTACQESGWSGGLRVGARSARLSHALARSTQLARKSFWAGWFRSFVPAQLAKTLESVNAKCHVTAAVIEEELAGGEPRPWSRCLAKRVRRDFQKRVNSLLVDRIFYDAERRVRENLARFGMRDRRQAGRCLARLRLISPLVPPRVWAASFGVIWNRWSTARRSQLTASTCLLGCAMGEDSLEHYGRCPTVWRFAKARLQLCCRYSTGSEYWCLSAPDDRDTVGSKDWWARLALLHYSVLRTTNAARSRGCLTSTEDATRALQQAAMEGCRGHPLARVLTRCLAAPSTISTTPSMSLSSARSAASLHEIMHA